MTTAAAPPPTVVILTALEVEYLAIIDHLQRPLREIHQGGTLYEHSHFTGRHSTWRVILAQSGQGNVSAALHTDRAWAAFQPDVMLLVGVAGGLRDVRKGDVVAADIVYGYEEARSAARSSPRIKTTPSSYHLVQRARATARKGMWIDRLRTPFPTPPKAFVAPIASGEKIVAARRGTAYSILRKNCGDALAVEKEGYGFLTATHAHHTAQATVIRGISDLLTDKTQPDDGHWQPIAARNAAAFAFELLDGTSWHDNPIQTRWFAALR